MHFLDRRTFAANDPDAKELLQAVIERYGVSAPVKNLVQEAPLKLASIFWDAPMADVWPKLLEKAAQERKLRRLVELVASDKTNEGWEIFRRLVALPPESTHARPWLVSLIRGGRRPFIDRGKLRDHLPVLLNPDGERVLIVSGPKASGRSYSWYLIAHVSEITREYEACLIDLANWVGKQATPIDLMQDIANQLGWEKPEADSTAQPDTHARILLSWFKNKMRSEPIPRWLVFDGLDAGTTSDAALRLVENIASAAERHEAGELRVVLLAFTRLLPSDVDPFALRDPLNPIGVPQIKAFFESVGLEAGQPVTDDVLDTLVMKLLGTPPHPDPLPLGEVGPRAARLANDFFYNPEVVK